MSDQRLADDIDDELRAHLELAAQYLEQTGAGLESSRRLARARFGDPARIRDQVLRVYQPIWVRGAAAFGDAFGVALAFGLFVAFAGVVLGLHAPPLTFHSPGDWVSVWQPDGESKEGFTTLSTYHDWRQLSERHDVFDIVTAARYETRVVAGPFPTQLARIKRATWGYAEDVGARLSAGRSFEEHDAGSSVAVLTNRASMDWYAGSGAAIGQVIEVGGHPTEIIGVLEPGVEFFYDTQILAPLVASEEIAHEARRLLLVGRLRPGLALEAANRILAKTEAAPQVVSVDETFARPFQPVAYLLAALGGGIAIWAVINAIIARTWMAGLAGVVVGLACGFLITPIAGVAIAGDTARTFDFSTSALVVALSLALPTACVAAILGIRTLSSRIGWPMRWSAGAIVQPAVVHAFVAALVFGGLTPLLSQGARAWPTTLPAELVVAVPTPETAGYLPGDWASRLGPGRTWAYAAAVPGADGRATRSASADGARAAPLDVGVNAVSSDFFRITGLALGLGSGFRSPGQPATSADGSAATLQFVPDRTAARLLFGREDPIGARVRVTNEGVGTVVGIAPDVQYGPGGLPTIYRLADPEEQNMLLAITPTGGTIGPMGPDALGPFPVQSVAKDQNRRSAFIVLLCALAVVAQLLALSTSLRRWGGEVTARVSNDLRLRRVVGATRTRLIRRAIALFCAPLATGVACAWFATVVLVGWGAVPMRFSMAGVVLPLLVGAAILAPRIWSAASTEAPASFDALTV